MIILPVLGILSINNYSFYLDENTQNNLDDVEKFLLGIDDNLNFLDRVHTAGDVFRKEFKTNTFMKNY